MQNNPYQNPSQNHPNAPLLAHQYNINNYPEPNAGINNFAPPPPPPRNAYANHVPGHFNPQPLYTGAMPGFLPNFIIHCSFCNR
jgi:hypothetical protein